MLKVLVKGGEIYLDVKTSHRIIDLRYPVWDCWQCGEPVAPNERSCSPEHEELLVAALAKAEAMAEKRKAIGCPCDVCRRERGEPTPELDAYEEYAAAKVQL